MGQRKPSESERRAQFMLRNYGAKGTAEIVIQAHQAKERSIEREQKNHFDAVVADKVDRYFVEHKE